MGPLKFVATDTKQRLEAAVLSTDATTVRAKGSTFRATVPQISGWKEGVTECSRDDDGARSALPAQPIADRYVTQSCPATRWKRRSTPFGSPSGLTESRCSPALNANSSTLPQARVHTRRLKSCLGLQRTLRPSFLLFFFLTNPTAAYSNRRVCVVFLFLCFTKHTQIINFNVIVRDNRWLRESFPAL